MFVQPHMVDTALSLDTRDHARLGPLWVAFSERGLVALFMQAEEAEVRERLAGYTLRTGSEQGRAALAQIARYLDGKQQAFDVPIDWSVLSPFQKTVLEEVSNIPYGRTRTYQEIADALGQPGAARAVGRANATNPMPLVIPCHRVVGASGALHGYSGPGGVETKAWLLQLEGSRLI